MSITLKLQQLFQSYQEAFIEYDIDKVSRCYHLPCTLNTPEQITLLNSKEDCESEFSTIFSQLKEGNISRIVAQKASFSVVTDSLSLVCVDWDFIDADGEVYADFTAIYHVVQQGEKLEIINVTSHDLECSLSLDETFNW
ncbi:hypothetical protein [Colwellia echini]|uniref:SnoaL-like domain-containing protein n=1 Tax=Colwellia echini TaxID=1982103 RepID=A0ABY3MWA1_9GAMM|nr:hypothetical protein [Colwellia echini]TYK65483.1 hypothetical protein CWS31_010340 [Colwellia echini]